MTKHVRLTAVLVCLAGLLLAGSGCSYPVTVGSTWAPQTVAMSSPGKTFMWAVPKKAPAVAPTKEALQIRDAIHGVVEEQFTAKGYENLTSGTADFWVMARMTRTPQGDAHSEVPFEEYNAGTLELYVVDPATGKWLWRAWAEARLDPSNSPELKRKRLQETVSRMLQQFPSRKQGGKPSAG